MASRSDIEAGRAKVTIWADTSPLMRGLRIVETRLKSLGTSIMGLGRSMVALGAGIAAPLNAAVAHFTSAGDALDEMRARTGISAAGLAELGYAAKLSGSDMEGVEKGITKMQKTLYAAAHGSAESAKAFHRLGLSVAVLKTMSPEEQFGAIAEKLAEIKDPADKAAMAMAIFGKSGTSLIPMMDGLKAAKEEARQLGIVPSEASVKMAAEMADAFDKVTATVSAVFYEIGAALAPVILPAAQAVVKISAAIIQWVRANGELIQTVAIVAAGVIAAGVAVVTVGAAIFGLGSVVGMVATVLSGLGAVLAFLVTPFGMVLAGTAAVVAGFIYLTNAGAECTAFISQAFTGLATTVSEVLGSIVDALMLGDIAAAGKVMWAGLVLIWHENTQTLNQYWQSAKFFFLDTWQSATSAMAGFFIDAYAVIRSGWAEAAAFIAQLWDSVTGGDQSVKIEEKRQEAQKQIEADRKGAKSVLNEDYEREKKALMDGYDKGLADKRKAVDQARAELSAIRADVSRRKQSADSEQGTWSGGFGEKGMGGPNTDTTAVFGTFSASAAAAIGNSDRGREFQEMKEIRKINAEQLRELREARAILRTMKNPVFK